MSPKESENYQDISEVHFKGFEKQDSSGKVASIKAFTLSIVLFPSFKY